MCLVNHSVSSRDRPRAVRSEGSQRPKDHAESLEEYLKIPKDGLFLDVFDVEPDPIVEGGLAPPADLPQTGDARPDLEPHVAPGRTELHLPGGQRSRTDQAHLPLQDVPQLGHLINAVLAQEPPEDGGTRVVLDLEDRPVHFAE